jgi:hypothetical protein
VCLRSLWQTEKSRAAEQQGEKGAAVQRFVRVLHLYCRLFRLKLCRVTGDKAQRIPVCVPAQRGDVRLDADINNRTDCHLLAQSDSAGKHRAASRSFSGPHRDLRKARPVEAGRVAKRPCQSQYQGRLKTAFAAFRSEDNVRVRVQVQGGCTAGPCG